MEKSIIANMCEKQTNAVRDNVKGFENVFKDMDEKDAQVVAGAIADVIAIDILRDSYERFIVPKKMRQRGENFWCPTCEKRLIGYSIIDTGYCKFCGQLVTKG